MDAIQGRSSIAAVCAAVVALSGCGGGGGNSAPPLAPAYTIGGTVTGLSGSGLVLQNNAGNDLPVNTSGSFAFGTAIGGGSAYAVTVKTQPSNPVQQCTVANGSSIANANVTTVAVTCATITHTIGGNVSGLSGAGLVLRMNGANDLSVAASGAFTFAGAYPNGSAYAVTVQTQPSNPAQLCAVTNGSSTLTANVANVAVTCSTNSYAIGGTVTGLSGAGLVLQNNAGDNLTVTTNGPFTFQTAISSGGTYAVTVQSRPLNPVQTCTVTNGAGTVSNSAINAITVTCVPVVSRFAYTANYDDRSISMFTVNPTSGQLRHNGYVLAGASGTALNPHSIAVDSVNGFAFGSNFGSATLTVYRAGSNGKLTALADMTTGLQPRGVAVDPANRFVYVANSGANTVSAYRLNATTGALTAVTGSPFTAGTNPFGVTIDATGRFAYVINFANGLPNGSVSVFAIETDGALTSIDANSSVAGIQSTIASGNSSHAIVLHPSGQFAYAVNFGSADISIYQVGANGALAPASTTAAGSGARGFAIDASGRFGYVANHVLGTIQAYSIDAQTGALTPLQSIAVSSPGNVTLEANGRFLYAPSLSQDVTALFSVAANGTLTRLPDVNGRHGNLELAMATGSSAVTYTPRYAYASGNVLNDIATFAIDATSGVLTAIGSPVAGGGNTSKVTLDPSARFAYVSNTTDDTIGRYAINEATGVLSLAGTSPTGDGPLPFAFEPSGRFAYIATTGDSRITAYSVNASTGALTAIGTPLATENTPFSVQVDPAGRFLYVANFGNDSISTFALDTVAGTLTAIGSPIPAGDAPQDAVFDPTGKFFYAANSQSGSISMYRVNAVTGAASSLGVALSVGGGACAVSVDPSGGFAYAALCADDSVATFGISSTGLLTEIGSRTMTGDLPTVFRIDASGQFGYVTNRNGFTISGFSRNPTTGVLARIDLNPGNSGLLDVGSTGNSIAILSTVQ